MSKFSDARKIMAKHLDGDDGLYIAYHANVAMVLHDKSGIRSERRRNQIADEILRLIFELGNADAGYRRELADLDAQEAEEALEEK